MLTLVDQDTSPLLWEKAYGPSEEDTACHRAPMKAPPQWIQNSHHPAAATPNTPESLALISQRLPLNLLLTFDIRSSFHQPFGVLSIPVSVSCLSSSHTLDPNLRLMLTPSTALSLGLLAAGGCRRSTWHHELRVKQTSREEKELGRLMKRRMKRTQETEVVAFPLPAQGEDRPCAVK
ncbi:unnamed protein product [Pleuronectes platessa]|uniref:Uncharacterized protein n=1 Tax=Pleuronectes platessa TaxID=8262 RepID=A0A9N7ZDC9_PLEPL|nr:unnamed protein product [Pleuronectes platessa]